MLRSVFAILCAGFIVVGATLHGRATNRWDALAPMDRRIEALHDAPFLFSDYVLHEIPSEMPIKEKSRVTCHQYVSPTLADPIVVSLTTGIPGSVSTHTPDVCYVGSGYQMLKKPTRQTIELPGGKLASYYVAEFEKKRPTGIDRQRVRWAWTADGTWDAPDSPRFRYLRERELAKIYVVTTLSESSASANDSPAVTAFFARCLSHYSQTLAR